MNRLLEWIVRIHSGILNLYPRSFREEFADEMRQVFRDCLEEAIPVGVKSLILVCLRELVGLPISILGEFWYEIFGESTTMNGEGRLWD